MAFIDLKFFSETYRTQASVYVILPQKTTKSEVGVETKAKSDKYKCLYLLHGISDDYSIWMRRTSLERYAMAHGIAIVMPMGARSFYEDMRYGGCAAKYYTFIAKELPAVMEELFNISSDPKDRFIGGNSMGGYGALKIALKEEGRYGAAFGLSLVSDIHNENFTEPLKAVFGDEIPDEADLFYLTKKHNNDKYKPRIFITIGKDDYMYEDAVRLNEQMKSLDYDYKYEATEGAHNWSLWDKTIQDALNWLMNK